MTRTTYGQKHTKHASAGGTVARLLDTDLKRLPRKFSTNLRKEPATPRPSARRQHTQGGSPRAKAPSSRARHSGSPFVPSPKDTPTHFYVLGRLVVLVRSTPHLSFRVPLCYLLPPLARLEVQLGSPQHLRVFSRPTAPPRMSNERNRDLDIAAVTLTEPRRDRETQAALLPAFLRRTRKASTRRLHQDTRDPPPMLLGLRTTRRVTCSNPSLRGTTASTGGLELHSSIARTCSRSPYISSFPP